MSQDTKRESLKILIADDHWIARNAVASLLGGLAAQIDLSEAANIDEALELLREENDVDLIIVDLNMPGTPVLESFPILRQLAPQAKIVVITVSENRADVLRCLEAGAVGYVPKTAPPDAILGTFERVLSGEVALPQKLLVNTAPVENTPISDDADLVRIGLAFDEFTPRQKEIFMMLATGTGNKDIASDLGLSVNTVRAHLQAITSKMKADNRAMLTLYASRWKDRGAA